MQGQLTWTYRSHQNLPRTWSKKNIFYNHALGVPRGRTGVEWGSNWGQTGVIKGFFTMRRALSNQFCAVSFGDYGIARTHSLKA